MHCSSLSRQCPVPSPFSLCVSAIASDFLLPWIQVWGNKEVSGVKRFCKSRLLLLGSEAPPNARCTQDRSVFFLIPQPFGYKLQYLHSRTNSHLIHAHTHSHTSYMQIRPTIYIQELHVAERYLKSPTNFPRDGVTLTIVAHPCVR